MNQSSAIRVDGHQRNKQKGHREELIKDLPVQEVDCYLADADMACPWCNTEMKPIGKEFVRQEIQFIPASLKVLKYYRYAYECPSCRKDAVQPPIILFEYKPSRGGANAATYLKDFRGYLHTDGYAGYEKVENVTRCGCWAHLRRYFVEAMPANAEKLLNITPAETGRDYCNKLFKIDRDLEELTPEERKIKRLKQEKPVLEAFWCWLGTLNPLKGSHLGKAVIYAFNQRPYMENYLLDGRCSISNNAAENSIRPFTVGRKNWEFAASTQGADASATVYSLVETAKANDLSVYKY